MRQQLLAEENERRLNDLRGEYILAIKEAIKRNWLIPPGSENMPGCEVTVEQGPGGIVLGVSVGTCPTTAIYRDSIEKAIRRSDPLPTPRDPALFTRKLTFIFRPEEL